jgi:hypothetical protein
MDQSRVMTPNFALVLSFEGISLLHRTGSGWSVLGETTIDDPKLAERMKEMRNKAEARADGAFTTKVVLPNEQIKYIETRLEPGKNRRETIEDALDGKTPYEIDQLVYAADTTHPIHIAAVARETLDEAEEFALTHRMNPVCFVACPPERKFDGEPFFGPTKSAANFISRPQNLTAAPQAVRRRPDAQNAQTNSVIAKDIPLAHPVEIGVPTEIDNSVSSNKSQANDLAHEDIVSATPLVFKRTLSSSDLAPLPSEGRRETPPSAKPNRLTEISYPKTSEANTKESLAGFTSRRPLQPALDATETPIAEKEQPDRNSHTDMTIFGAQGQHETRISHKSIGLAVTSVVLLALMGVALWAFFFSTRDFAGYFNGGSDPDVPAVATPPAPNPETQLASLIDPDVVETSLLLAPTPEELADAGDGTALPTPEEAQSHYATTGIWQLSPLAPLAPSGQTADDLYVASIDRSIVAQDAVALPESGTYQSDVRPLALLAPPPAGTVFDLDENGLVQATEDGALNPNGIRVYAGRPRLSPPLRTGSAPQALITPDLDRLANLRPAPRPGGLIERAERAQFGGRSRSELADLRPSLRPTSAQEIARNSETSADEAATEYAVAASVVPRGRPAGFDQTVALARAAAPSDTDAVQVASAAAIATPSIPTRASVARQATVENALNLRQINLIGVYGKSNDRRALIRLANGRYVKVQIGDRVDGGQVASIGEAELSYVKRGKNIVLRMPRG